eukprot:6172895-Pleurochrysis_carterae.AAC.3
MRGVGSKLDSCNVWRTRKRGDVARAVHYDEATLHGGGVGKTRKCRRAKEPKGAVAVFGERKAKTIWCAGVGNAVTRGRLNRAFSLGSAATHGFPIHTSVGSMGGLYREGLRSKGGAAPLRLSADAARRNEPARTR